jgi:hypothetical protein
VESAALAVRGRVAPDAALVSLAPVLRRTVERFALDGSARVEIGLRGDGQTVELVGKADASDLAIAAGGAFAKPAAVPLRGEFAASVPADASAIHLRDLVVEGADFQFRADATIGLLKEQPPASHLALNVPRLRRFSSRVPFLEPYAVEGSLFLEAELTAREGRPLAKYVTVTAGDLIGVLGGKACRLDGSVTLEQVGWDGQSISIGRLVTAGLGLSLGNSRGFLVADVRDPLTAPAGEAELLCPDLDVYDLSQWESPRPPALSPLTSQQGEALGRQADEFVARLRRLVLPADARLRMKMDRMRYYDSEVKAMYEVRSMVAEVEARKGLLRASFRAALNGGDMEQNYRVNLDDPQPRLSVQGDMREVMSGEHVLAQLAKEFPGNTVYGTFSRSQDLTYRLRDVVINCLDGRFRPVAVGEARFLTEDGLLRGRAAPRFIANIFPGLNLAPYRYRRMTGFTGYNADGSSDSDMIFGGTAYDLYIEGTTDAQRIGRYEIGVILVGTPQSAEFNHKFRLGRVPVLKFKARIEGGQFYDEEVWYPYPTETAFRIFLKNNIFYRLWLDSLRRGGSRAIIPGPATAPAGGK